MITFNKTNPKNALSLSPKDRDFVDLVLNRITMYGEIPYSLPELLVVDLIKSSHKYFLHYFSGAVETSYYSIENSDLINYAGVDNFRTLSVQIDPKIRTVWEIYETNTSNNRQRFIDNYDGNSSDDNQMVGINRNLYMIEAAVRMVEQRAFNSIFNSKCGFDFSFETSTLLFKQQPKGTSIVLKVSKCVDIDTLYNNALFERHVIANAKKELKRKIGGHTVTLPGGVTLNADEICSGIEDAENVETIIKAASGVGDIILKR